MGPKGLGDDLRGTRPAARPQETGIEVSAAGVVRKASSHRHHGNVRSGPPDLLDHLETVSARHMDVTEHEVEVFLSEEMNRLVPMRGQDDLMPSRLKHCP